MTERAVEILFVRSSHLEGDSRSMKMIADYQRRAFQVTPVVWTRGLDRPLPRGTIAFQKKGLQGARFRNAWYFLRWHFFLMWFLFRNRGRHFILHCVDFDAAIVAVPLARLFGKPIVYDGFDHFGSASTGVLAGLFSLAERFLINLADILILPDRSRMDQYGLSRDVIDPIVIANIPDAGEIERSEISAASSPRSGPIRIAYIGTLEARHRGLEFIPSLCEELPGVIEFIVGGVGTLEGMMIENAARLPNLEFVGYLPYPEALRIMASADCLYGPYLLTSRHHLYASPNKMYEHLALGRPLITNEGTPPGQFVKANESGLVFDGSYGQLRALISGLDRDDLKGIGAHARDLWVRTYSGLRSRQIETFFRRLDSVLRLSRYVRKRRHQSVAQ